MPVRVLGLSSISRKVRRVLDQVKGDRELFERIGRTAVRHIQDRTAEGLDKNGQPLKPLKPITIGRRAHLEKMNKTSVHYQAAKSNLHFTGQLLRSLRFMFNKSQIVIEVDPARKPYVVKSEFRENKKGTNAKEVKTRAANTPTNRELVQYQREGGREFMGADESLKVKIRDMVARKLRQILRRRGR